jgi:hypothetical protein
MTEDSLLTYSRGLLVYDSVNTMFRSYLTAIHYNITNERLDELVKKYLDMYMDYVVRSFEELDLQTMQTHDNSYITTEELMSKVTNLVAAKLVAELLLVELRKEIQ